MALTAHTAPGLHADLLRWLPRLPPGARILDIGCGTGAWLSLLAHVASERVGVERDISGIACDGVERVAADLNIDSLTQLSGRTFDLVSSIEVLEHLENPGHLIASAASHIAPGGYLLLTTPNVHSVAARLRHLVCGSLRQFDERGDPTHVLPIPLIFFERVLPRHGLAIERVWGFPRRGTRIARPPVALALSGLERLFPVVVPGDILCVLARRAAR